MKQLKALDILKLCQAVDDLNTRPIIKDIQDAVIELKALQEDLKLLQQELKDSNEAYLILLKQYHALNEPKSCNYSIESDWNQDNIYHFECGYSYVTIEGDLHENGINYCPSCGGIAKPKEQQ